MKGKMAEEYV